ncbi:MAG: UbiX family flavin prenyltransferase [Burkholderiales bacterium]|nr:UbiX family flavin prenyltransferase [Burkholderiales bacterium]
MEPGPQRIIVAITGASGAAYGVRALEALRAAGGWQTHVVVSNAGALNARHELGMSRQDIEALADVAHDNRDIGAAIASGSFLTRGMIVAPCSMKTLASVAHAFSDNLIARAADVVLKERRRLVLVTRETPLNLAHLRNMVAVTEMGGIVFPPVPALYASTTRQEDLIAHSVGRVLDLFGITDTGLVERWTGIGAAAPEPAQAPGAGTGRRGRRR